MMRKINLNHWRGVSLFELIFTAVIVDGLVIALMFGLF